MHEAIPRDLCMRQRLRHWNRTFSGGLAGFGKGSCPCRERAIHGALCLKARVMSPRIHGRGGAGWNQMSIVSIRTVILHRLLLPRQRGVSVRNRPRREQFRQCIARQFSSVGAGPASQYRHFIKSTSECNPGRGCTKEHFCNDPQLNGFSRVLALRNGIAGEI